MESERDYRSVKLDDPSFLAPIYATLVEVEGGEGLPLIWSRRVAQERRKGLRHQAEPLCCYGSHWSDGNSIESSARRPCE